MTAVRFGLSVLEFQGASKVVSGLHEFISLRGVALLAACISMQRESCHRISRGEG